MRPALLRSISSCVEPALCKGRGRDPPGALEAVPPQRSSLHPQERPSVPAGFRVSKRVAYEKQKASERLTERRGQLLTAPPKRQLALFGNWLLHKQDAGGVGVGAVTVGTSAPQSGAGKRPSSTERFLNKGRRTREARFGSTNRSASCKRCQEDSRVLISVALCPMLKQGTCQIPA